LVKWEGGGYKERVQEVNMWKNYVLMYENGKMRPADTIVRRRGRGDKRE
jgi:hypothetical protein